ncbi:unnamed protein product [Symbiodinium sp. CCMP2592]|nr:unnamed protein product [Symbiodinium sp. CCMP2592]
MGTILPGMPAEEVSPPRQAWGLEHRKAEKKTILKASAQFLEAAMDAKLDVVAGAKGFNVDEEAFEGNQMQTAARFRPEVHQRLAKSLHELESRQQASEQSLTKKVPEKSREDDAKQELHDQVARLQVESLQHMVSRVTYNVGEFLHETKVIYFTNKQALHFTAERMPKVREALGIQEPKLVIWLIPSLCGHSFWKGQSRLKDFLPTKTVPELFGHEEKVERQMNMVARDVLLPVAMQTNALIVGRSTCSLTTAFAEVSEPIQNSLGASCPFQLLIVENARNYYIPTKLKPNSFEQKLLQSNNTWRKADFIPSLTQSYGVDPVLWPRHRLVEGAAAYVVFECLDEKRLHDPRAAVQFENIFVSSLRTSLPVLGLWTGGDVNVLKYEALNCVTNGIPLILLDSRPELVAAEKAPDGPPDDEPEVLLEDKATTPAAPTRYDIHVAAERLRKHSEALNRLILFDTMVGSALACVRASLKHKVKEHRVDKQLWLYDAVIRATLQSHHERGDANPEDLSIEDEDVSMATEILINHVADQLSKEATVNTSRLEDGIEALRACEDWAQLEEEWTRQWEKLCYFAVWNGWDDITITVKEAGGPKQVPLLRGPSPEAEFQTSGRPQVRLSKDGLPPGVQFAEVRATLFQHLDRWLAEARKYDHMKKSPPVVKNDKRLWLATYELLKSDDVYSIRLSDHRSLKQRIQALSRSDRLPKASSLEGLLLLRCAWTLADIFDEKARWLKRTAKLSFFLVLSLGVMITFVTTSTLPTDLSDEQKKYAVLGLSLASSSLAAWTTFTDPSKKWMKLRTASQRLQAEIWKFRTRVGLYGGTDYTHLSVGADEAERQAEKELRDRIFAIADSALGPKDQLSSSMTTDDICVRLGVDEDAGYGNQAEGSTDLVSLMKKRLQKNVTAAHRRHKQYPPPAHSKQPAAPDAIAAEDSHHAPATPEEYIIWRLNPLREFYQKRIPKVRYTRMAFQVLFLMSTALTSVLAVSDQTTWTPLVVAISAALASWQEFRGVDMKLERYGAVVAALRNMMLWWQTLPEVDKANVRHIETLVGKTEMAAYSELSAWLSDAQQARDLVERTSSSQAQRLKAKVS